MSRKISERLLECILQIEEYRGELYLGILGVAEKKEGDNLYRISIANHPSVYQGMIKNLNVPPYIQAIEVLGKHGEDIYRAEIVAIRTKDSLKLARAEVVKERDGRITKIRDIDISKKKLEDLSRTLDNLLINTFKYAVSGGKFQKIKTALSYNFYEINSIIQKSELTLYFKPPLNNIRKYPRFEGRISITYPDPSILQQASFYR